MSKIYCEKCKDKQEDRHERILGVEMEEIGEFIKDYQPGVIGRKLSRITYAKLYQCPNCKTIKLI